MTFLTLTRQTHLSRINMKKINMHAFLQVNMLPLHTEQMMAIFRITVLSSLTCLISLGCLLEAAEKNRSPCWNREPTELLQTYW